MKATSIWNGALIAMACVAVPAFADEYSDCSPYSHHCRDGDGRLGLFQRLPSFFYPGYRPWTPMFGAAPPQQPTGAAFPYHPYMRGPRDFFMWREAMEDAQRR